MFRKAKTRAMTTELTDVESAAETLGEAIATLPEHERFERARRAVEESDTAQRKIDRFEALQQEYQLAKRFDQETEADLERLRSVQEELHALPVMEEYLAAQSALQDRLESINRAVSSPIAVDFASQVGGCCQDE